MLPGYLYIKLLGVSSSFSSNQNSSDEPKSSQGTFRLWSIGRRLFFQVAKCFAACGVIDITLINVRFSTLSSKFVRSWQTARRLERPNNRGPWRQTAGFKALTTYACGQSAWSKLPRGILGVWGLANASLNALTTEGHGGKRQASRL